MAHDTKQLRYRIMLALYLPILLYSFSTFDLQDTTTVFSDVEPVLVEGEVEDKGEPVDLSKPNDLTEDVGEAIPADSLR